MPLLIRDWHVYEDARMMMDVGCGCGTLQATEWSAMGADQGLIPRVLRHVFERIEKLREAESGDLTFKVRCVGEEE